MNVLADPCPPPPEAVSSLDQDLRPLLAELAAVIDGGAAHEDLHVQMLAEFRRLRGRLAAAETALVLYCWSPDRTESDVEKAAYEAWQRWLTMVPPGFCDPDWHPHLSQEAIAAMAAERDEIRARVLSRLTDGFLPPPAARTVSEGEVSADADDDS